MHRGRGLGGYTIVEVMMFLAISSFMFVLAAFFIQGKQATAQFTQAMNSINSSVQQVINNVSDNNYPELNEQCTTTSSGLSLAPYGSSASSTNEQGSNLGCIVLGQVLQFGVSNTSGQDYNTYTVAGCQYVVSGACTQDFTIGLPPTSFSAAHATVIDPNVASPPMSVIQCEPASTTAVNMTSCSQLEWGMYATAMFDYQSSTGNVVPTNSVGFFGSFASQTPDGEGLLSGSQDVEVVDPGLGTTPSIDIRSTSTNNENESQMASNIDSYLPNAAYIPSPYFVVCFSDGHGHVGALTIGGGNSSVSSGQRLATSIQISDNTIYPFGSTVHKADACKAI